MDNAEFQLVTPTQKSGLKDIALLRSDGVSEVIFTSKSPEKPYSWMAKVISIGVATIGGISIGAEARKEYLKGENITFNKEVLSIPLSEINTFLVEIHRRLWENIIPKQTCLCKYCGNKMIVDIDLDKIEYLEEDKELIDDGDLPTNIVCELPEGFSFEGIGRGADIKYQEHAGVYKRLTFRIPVLNDAILNEKYFKNSVEFWRRVGFDCLQSITKSEQEDYYELPKEVVAQIGRKLFTGLLGAKDLKSIRTALRESLPIMPFHYEEECTDCKRMTPISVESSGFFSE